MGAVYLRTIFFNRLRAFIPHTHSLTLSLPFQFAVKRCKHTFSDWVQVQQQREVRAINDLSASSYLCRRGCDNIVRVYDIAREKDSRLYFVMEYMERGTLHEFLEKTRQEREAASAITVFHQQREPSIPESQIRSIVSHCLQGLCYIHSRGYMHRDIKPENILMGHNGVVKLADFSLARKEEELASHGKRLMDAVSLAFLASSEVEDDDSGNMTTYVATRWYRAPEILWGYPVYTSAVDIFALGLVVAEIYLLLPLLQGENQAHQQQLMMEVLGNPFPLYSHSMGDVQVEDSAAKHTLEEGLTKAVPTATNVAIRFMADMLRMDPNQRCTAKQARADASFFQQTTTTQSNKRRRPFEASPSPTFTATTPKDRPAAGRAPFVTVYKEDRPEMTSLVHEPNEVARAFLFS